MSKIDIQNPKKYLGKEKGDTTLARVAHVNHAIKIAEENNGQLFPLDMGYEYYPEASQVVPSGTIVRYNGGPDWVGYKLTGSVFPGGTQSGSFVWYLCTVRTKMEETWGPVGIIPYSLTGMVTARPGNITDNVSGAFSKIGAGALVYDSENTVLAPVDNMFIQTYTWNNGEPDADGFFLQDLLLVVDTTLTAYEFACMYQFEFLVPEGTEVNRFFD